MKLFNVVSKAIVAALALSGASAFAQSYPSGVYIRSISYAGTGCPAGTVAQNVSADAQAFTLLFDSFVAQTAPGLPPTESRKNCTLNIDLAVPPSWSYSIFTVDYRGYANLEPGVTGIQKSTYYFQGQRNQINLQTTIVGPQARDYSLRDTLGLQATEWSPCGGTRALNINAQVRVEKPFNRPQASGLMTIDSIDGEVKLIYGLAWRRC